MNVAAGQCQEYQQQLKKFGIGLDPCAKFRIHMLCLPVTAHVV